MTFDTELNPTIPEFPVDGLMPKRDTEAEAFLKKYPEYDGRGTVIAILDTGVDPGAAGLQFTTDGKPKVLDFIDCTGAGDVETTVLIKPTTNDDGLPTLPGLSGRTLILNPNWKNPSDVYHLGIKRAYELFPNDLKSRLTKEHRKKHETAHHAHWTAVQTEINEWERAHPPSTPLSEDDVATKADLDARVEALKDMIKNYEDPGPILDCIVWFDGTDWRAVVDVSESGDLRDQDALTDYKKEHRHQTFSTEDLLNFSVNIYDDGNLLSIVTVAGSHGTHVAGIAAANFPDEPALNGVAPGAQLISLKIGDTRMGSMESGDGLSRAAIALAEYRCDLANMSYGEFSAHPTNGYFVDLLKNEVCGRLGCIFVTSAGNDGPCITSIGAPAGMWAGLITVGGYVKHAQIQAEYALWKSVPERPYTWSSRGPTVDGYQGVDVYAPGSAITSVPQYTLMKLGLKNGTSMASPNACGCIALVVSALKANNEPITPYRIKKAVINSAKSVNDPMGIGFIQVERMWEYLQKYGSEKDIDILFQILVQPTDNRGVYLRELGDTNKVVYRNIFVEPTFMLDQEPDSGDHNTEKFEYEGRFTLISTQSWVHSPDFLYLHNGGRSFGIMVDPTQLATGEFHYAEIHGYDPASPSRGPLFTVPITVTKPIVLTTPSLSFTKISFTPGVIFRRFVHIPDGATFADITIRSKSIQATTPASFFLHVLQLVPLKSLKGKTEYSFQIGKGSYSDANSDEQLETRRFAVRSGLNMEVTLAQFWSAPGTHVVDIELSFHGVQVMGNAGGSSKTVFINGNEGASRLDIVAPFRREENVSPSISLDILRKSLRPAETTMQPQSAQRYKLPNSRQVYSLILTYNFKLSEGANVTVRFPSLNNQVYDQFISGMFIMICDLNCRTISYLDIFPKSVKIDSKGDYRVRLQISSDDQELLEQLRSTICLLDISQPKSVSLNVHRRLVECFTSKKATFSKTAIEKGEQRPLYIAAPPDNSSYPKDARVGDMLIGSFNLVNSKRVDGGQYTLVYIVPPEPIKPKPITATSEGGRSDTAPTDQDLSQQLADAMRDIQLSFARKFSTGSVARTQLLSEMASKDSKYLALLETQLDFALNGADAPNISNEQAIKVIAAADKILDTIDLQELATYYGVRQDVLSAPENSPRKRQRKENDRKKAAVVTALRAKCLAQLSTILQSQNNDNSQEFEETYALLQQWLDLSLPSNTTDLRTLLIYIRREQRAGRHGNALKVINKFIADTGLYAETIKDLRRAYVVRREIIGALEWTAWSAYEERWALIKMPPTGYAPL